MLVARWHHHPVAAQFFRLIPLKPAYFVNEKTIICWGKPHLGWFQDPFSVVSPLIWCKS